MRTLFAGVLRPRPPQQPSTPGYQQEWWGPARYTGPLTAPDHGCYHYTTARGWHCIQSAGVIAPHTDYPEQPHALAWCTVNPIYEFGALKPGLEPPPLRPYAVFARMVQVHGPLYRLVLPLDAAPVTMRQIAEHDPRHAAAYRFFFADPQMQAIAEHPWRGSYDPIPASQWQAVEVWDDQAANWLPYNLEGHISITQGDQQ